MDQDTQSSGDSSGARPHPGGPSDNDIVAACLRNEAWAWSELVDRFGRLVYAIPHRFHLPPDACDDIFQNVFAITLRELPRIRDRASLPKWLMTVAHHETYRWIRNTRNARAGGGPALPPLTAVIEAEPAESELLRLEQRHIIQTGIEQLGHEGGGKGRCRELLTALFLDPSNPSYQDIAARLEMPVGAIGPTRTRCLRKLLELVGDRLQ